MSAEYHPIDFLFAKKVFPDAPEKASHFLAHLLKTAREGHLCLHLSEPSLLEGAALLPETLFDEILVRRENRIYLRRNWECEHRFLTHLQRIRSQKPALAIHLGEELEKESLNQEQKQAILKVASQSLTLISGGPGTGKTYTAARLIHIFLAKGIKRVVVAAPTGKATANIRTALGNLSSLCTIKTLHSLLKQKEIWADLILVDEGSMVDAELMATLFSAVQEGARLVLLGDKDQLPPIESGHFFSDLSRDPESVAELKTCLRAELQEIVEWAACIKRGEPIPFTPLPDVRQLIQEIVARKITVLTPLRKGLFGVEYLNQQLFLEHEKRGAQEVPIMVTVNNPTLELFNGDTGILNLENRIATFSGERHFPEYLLPRYEYAYVLSVHKSQGSEYERVMVILPKGSEIFGREMLYTALTRAKKHVTLFAHEGVVEKLVTTPSQRHSGVRLC